MQIFKIRYSDGLVSAVHEATLELYPKYWLIHYYNAEGASQTVRWELDRITGDLNFTTIFIFSYGDFPKQMIETTDANLPAVLRSRYPDKVFAKVGLDRKGINSIAGLIALIVGTVLLLGAAFFYGLPFLAEKIAMQIPQHTEEQLGGAMYERMISSYEIDSARTEKATAFVRLIDFKTSYPIEITVVHHEEANAFALPGGHIVVYDKILNGMRTKEELAALLSHEVAHVHYRHSLRTIARSLANYLFFSLILNDINGVMAVILDNSNMLLNLSYSRELETEADRKGMDSLESQGISLKGFINLFELLRNESKMPGGIEMLSSHPLSETRLINARKAAKAQTDIRDQPKLELAWKALRKE